MITDYMEIDIAELDIYSLDIPETTITVAYEYEPAEVGNRAGHPDTWTPDEPAQVSMVELWWEEGGIPVPAWHFSHFDPKEVAEIENHIEKVIDSKDLF